MGSLWDSYFIQGGTIVYSFLDKGHYLILYCPMFGSKGVAYLKPSNFNNKSCILVIGKGFLLNLLLSSLKSEMKQNVLFFLGIIKVGTTYF